VVLLQVLKWAIPVVEPHLFHVDVVFRRLGFAFHHSKKNSAMENGTLTQGEGKDPSGFLSEIIGNPVTVKLNSGVVYKGEFCSPNTDCVVLT
jgi:hypothetical protein